MTDDNFKDAPKSIGELRAEKDDSAASWKPRDLLIAMLRDIDGGKHPEILDMVICFRFMVDDQEASSSRVVSSTRNNLLLTIGLLERCKERIMKND